jgi:hypothetical protein
MAAGGSVVDEQHQQQHAASLSPAIPAPSSPAPTSALFTVDVTSGLGAEYVPMALDVVRMVCIQLTIQLMVYMSGPQTEPFFSAGFATLLAYVVLGVLLYWLVVRRIVRFV